MTKILDIYFQEQKLGVTPQKLALKFRLCYILIIVALVAWTSNVSAEDTMSLQLQSTAFKNNHSIPTKYTCEGSNIFPPLSWTNEPKNTKSFVLIIDDPDAPNGTWDHLIIFNISETVHELPENTISLPYGAVYGKNSWGKSAYDGPCPPKGEHRYFFKLYALDTTLSFSSAASKSQIESAMQSHILAETTLIGRYRKVDLP